MISELGCGMQILVRECHQMHDLHTSDAFSLQVLVWCRALLARSCSNSAVELLNSVVDFVRILAWGYSIFAWSYCIVCVGVASCVEFSVVAF